MTDFVCFNWLRPGKQYLNLLKWKQKHEQSIRHPHNTSRGIHTTKTEGKKEICDHDKTNQDQNKSTTSNSLSLLLIYFTTTTTITTTTDAAVLFFEITLTAIKALMPAIASNKKKSFILGYLWHHDRTVMTCCAARAQNGKSIAGSRRALASFYKMNRARLSLVKYSRTLSFVWDVPFIQVEQQTLSYLIQYFFLTKPYHSNSLRLLKYTTSGFHSLH